MASCLYRFHFLFVLSSLLTSGAVYAQSNDLRNDQPFFQEKRREFNLWLNQNQLGHIFYADSVSAQFGKVTLFIRPSYKGPRMCDSIQLAWHSLQQANRKINGQFFHERLLHKWAFMAEVHEDQAEVIIRCHEPPHFQARIYQRLGRIPVEERNARSAAVVEVEIPRALVGVNNGNNQTTLYGKKVGPVCAAARRYLINLYKTKGTPILWRARIDSSYTAYDEFVLEVTHLSDIICPDGYFEYHRIYVKGLQRGDDVELSWEFQGKYGSGIFFPPRKNDYKDLELRYRTELEEYQKRLFKQLIDYLRT